MKKVKHGDTIETERGSVLNVIEKKGILYLQNKNGGGVSHFKDLVVPYEIIKRK